MFRHRYKSWLIIYAIVCFQVFDCPPIHYHNLIRLFLTPKKKTLFGFYFSLKFHSYSVCTENFKWLLRNHNQAIQIISKVVARKFKNENIQKSDQAIQCVIWIILDRIISHQVKKRWFLKWQRRLCAKRSQKLQSKERMLGNF